ncbi:MAG: hypothetical protein DRH43_07620 [Deltaproteobacteria bacterium]|nr:MAG: hypothetical protein DRH50_11430 [Deltaproteobacteria bacterium]RLC09796.1 MAG: hypothetical protein DRH43_07620 [Deltaproteobacteria bacterium]
MRKPRPPFAKFRKSLILWRSGNCPIPGFAQIEFAVIFQCLTRNSVVLTGGLKEIKTVFKEEVRESGIITPSYCSHSIARYPKE